MFKRIFAIATAITTAAASGVEDSDLGFSFRDLGEYESHCDHELHHGDIAVVHYTGWIDESSKTGEKGKVIDSTEGKKPFTFKIGVNGVIKGWEEGLIGMCKGRTRELILPPDFSYGKDGNPPVIPGDATLRFEIELINIIEDDRGNVFDFIDKDKNKYLDKEEVDAFFSKRGTKTPPELWDEEDKDKDGRISWNEFSGPKGEDKPIAPNDKELVGNKEPMESFDPTAEL